jgi:NitT/TauT family transport system substrate-binding protein
MWRQLCGLAAACLVLATACAPSGQNGSAAPTPATSSANPNPNPTSAASRTKLTVSYSNVIADSMPLWTAKEGGYFDQNGLDVDLQYIASSNAFAALLAGQVQANAGGGSEVVSGVSNGADVVVVANLVPVYPYFMEAQASVKSAQDLKGKNVAITNPGATFDIASRVVLQRNGVDPDHDVNFIKTGSVQNVESALLSGQVEAGLAQVPDTLSVEAGGLHPLFDLASLSLPAAGTVVAVQRSSISGQRDMVQKLVDSIVQGAARNKQDRAFAISVLKKYLKNDDDTAMGATYDYFTQKVTPVLPFPKSEQFTDSVTVLSAQNPKVKDVDLNKLLDASFVQNAADRKLGS